VPYFREAVLGENREFKLGSIDQSGSKDLVALVSHTPCAIGYSGMGYHTADVKWLKVAKKKGDPGVEPSVESVKNKSYPLARPLYIYSLGEPRGAVKEYIDWILSRRWAEDRRGVGYVPSMTRFPSRSLPRSKPSWRGHEKRSFKRWTQTALDFANR
jgi:phosphate transport system substrate-binding protein